MKVVVDTNIIFSALLNSTGSIGDVLFNSDRYFEFYSCIYMRYEIDKHWDRLRNISKLSEIQLRSSYHQVVSKLKFVNEEIIPTRNWLNAAKMVETIDADDLDFVALTIFLKGTLWTGDKPLYNGLKLAGFKKVLNTKELIELRRLKGEKRSVR
jgi:predicted nucleic acid-binding protein